MPNKVSKILLSSKFPNSKFSVIIYAFFKPIIIIKTPTQDVKIDAKSTEKHSIIFLRIGNKQLIKNNIDATKIINKDCCQL